MLNVDLKDNSVVSFIKDKCKFIKEKVMSIFWNERKIEFSAESRVPDMIDEVIKERAELNNIIVEIGIFCSMLDINDKAECLYKSFSYDELKGNNEADWEEQLLEEINEFEKKKTMLEDKKRFLEREIQRNQNNNY